MSQKVARRSMRALSIEEKIQAIDRVHDGESKAAVARDIGVPESTLRGWCKGEERLRSSLALQGNGSPSSQKVPPSLHIDDAPLDFSKDRTPPLPTAPEAAISSAPDSMDYPVATELKQEALLYWMQRSQATLPVSPIESRTADSTADNSSWFWKLYKSYGVLPQVPSPEPPTNKRASGNEMSDEEDEPPATAADAVRHGEKFLRWLECCSDPSVTAVQILQFRYLLNNVKECAQRRRQGRVTKIRRRK